MRRIEKRLFGLNEEISRLQREIELTEGELNMHRHLADDAARDAAVSEGIERQESRMAPSRSSCVIPFSPCDRNRLIADFFARATMFSIMAPELKSLK